ncbi:MAG TPA: acetylxylan esterase [Tepidisphaeraceae bacterium]|nr:acetylxylan esterase [Tepidisphaeraceae bacterium]
MGQTTAPDKVAVPTLKIEGDRPTEQYKPGETIRFDVSLADAPSDMGEVEYTVKRDGGETLKSGTLDLANGSAEVSTSIDQPGTVQVAVTLKQPTTKPIVASRGAVVAFEQIERSAPRPDDFDAFWDGKIAQLQAIPINAQLEPVAEISEVDYSRVTLDNINGSKVYGQLAKPVTSEPGKKFSAMLIVQWAGVYPLQRGWVVDRAKEGWLAFNISAHDAKFDSTKEEYAKLNIGNYVAIGQTDRETSYFLRMFLSCHRAAEYLTTRDDWDGKILIVNGGSQGGLQAIVTAALHPKVTHVMANVPAGCDATAKQANRAFGWPYWQGRARGDDAEAIMNTSRYFDAVNFASRVTVPTLVGMGLVDATCPPAGVFAMYNELNGPKEILILPAADHTKGHGDYYTRVNQWNKAIRAGEPVPKM